MNPDSMNLDIIWEEYGFDSLQEGMNMLFPTCEITFSQLWQRLLSGDVIGALTQLLQVSIEDMAYKTAGLKNVFVWLLVLGIVSALMSHFVEVFDHHQTADLSFYFMYLITGAILLKCFGEAAEVAENAINDVAVFGKLMVPVYLLAVGTATGSVTAGAYYQILLLLICSVEEIVLKAVLPFTYTYCMLCVVNGVWVEEKLTMLIKLMEKVFGWVLKAALWGITGIGVFQSVLTPVVDSVKNSALQKAMGAIPGIGDGAEGVMKLAVGSAVIVKNSMGLGLLILLLALCAAPLLRILVMALMLKISAAFMGIVSDKRITACTDRIGNGVFGLFQLAGTTMLLFMVTIAITAVMTNRGF